MYLPEFCALYFINLLNLISPGAGCLLMVRNSSLYTRQVGLYTAFGIVSSSLIHKSYSLLGFGLIVSNTPWLFAMIKYLGAGYLSYIAFKTIIIHTRFTKRAQKNIDNAASAPKDLTPWGAFRMGFIVDMLNPAASLSFICIVVATVAPSTGLGIRSIYMVILLLTSLVWYLLLAFFFSNARLQAWVQSSGKWIDWIMGGFLFYLAGKLLFATAAG